MNDLLKELHAEIPKLLKVSARFDEQLKAQGLQPGPQDFKAQGLPDALGITLSGIVTSNTYNQLSEVLGRERKTRPVNLRIFSPGGELFAGLAVFSLLNSWEGPVHTHVDGLAASISSVIFMSGETRTMSEGSQLMIHGAHTIAIGDAREMRDTAEELERMSAVMAEIYAARSDRTAEQYLALFEEGDTLLGGEEAAEYGLATDYDVDAPFADEVVETETDEGCVPCAKMEDKELQDKVLGSLVGIELDAIMQESAAV